MNGLIRIVWHNKHETFDGSIHPGKLLSTHFHTHMFVCGPHTHTHSHTGKQRQPGGRRRVRNPPKAPRGAGNASVFDPHPTLSRPAPGPQCLEELKADPSILAQTDSAGQNPLHWASVFNNLTFLQMAYELLGRSGVGGGRRRDGRGGGEGSFFGSRLGACSDLQILAPRRINRILSFSILYCTGVYPSSHFESRL